MPDVKEHLGIVEVNQEEVDHMFWSSPKIDEVEACQDATVAGSSKGTS